MFMVNNKSSILHPYKQKKIYHKQKKPLFVISFDDGFETDYTKAYQIMKALGTTGTSFINTGAIGNSLILKWNQIHEMHDNGWDLQCHGHTHTRLTDFTTEAEIRNQFEQVDLAYQTQGLPVPKHHAWTYGVSTEQAREIIWDYRLTQRSTGFVLDSNNDHDTALPILTGFAGDTQYNDINRYNLVMDFIRNVYDKQKMGIFYFHRIHTETETTNGCYEQYFIDYLNYIQSLGIETLTISELYDRLI